jgi:signal transduction histidine kinase
MEYASDRSKSYVRCNCHDFFRGLEKCCPGCYIKDIREAEDFSCQWFETASGKMLRNRFQAEMVRKRCSGSLWNDVTAIHEEEARQIELVQEAQRKREGQNAAKTVFLSNMSHDIRTPMNAIIKW